MKLSVYYKKIESDLVRSVKVAEEKLTRREAMHKIASLPVVVNYMHWSNSNKSSSSKPDPDAGKPRVNTYAFAMSGSLEECNVVGEFKPGEASGQAYNPRNILGTQTNFNDPEKVYWEECDKFRQAVIADGASELWDLNALPDGHTAVAALIPRANFTKQWITNIGVLGSMGVFFGSLGSLALGNCINSNLLRNYSPLAAFLSVPSFFASAIAHDIVSPLYPASPTFARREKDGTWSYVENDSNTVENPIICTAKDANGVPVTDNIEDAVILGWPCETMLFSRPEEGLPSLKQKALSLKGQPRSGIFRTYVNRFNVRPAPSV